jgi:serine/threonine protein kinase
MPPEQFGGRAVPASDLYSLGATLIYLVTGTHPADLPQKDFRIQFEQAANLSFAFSHWLKWMTEPNLERRLPSAVKALEALEKPQAKYFPALSVTKPLGSKIMLIKTADTLEILIPPSGIKGSTVFMVLFAIAWNSFILFWTINALAAPFPANIPFVLFSLPFWGAGLQMVYLIVSSVCKRTRLHLDRFSVTFSSEILGWKWRRFPQIPTSEITKLVYTPRTFPAQLSLWAGVNEYQIAGRGAPFVESELEIEWLANQLSHWLNLPIQEQ